MDIVLGVSVAPATVRMVLIEGVNADGVTVDEDNFDVVVGDGSATSGAADRAIAAIQGTQESAGQAGHALTSTGVTWTEPGEAAALRDALESGAVGAVMLVSPLLAAAALAQTVGVALEYAHTALLFIEAESATVAVVDTSDGSIVDLHRRLVHSAEAIAELAEMVAGLDSLESHPDGVFVVGCGVDIVPIKPQLEVATSLPVNAPEEPDMALARAAALASANAPLFASSTAALAYAQDPGTGEVDPTAVAPVYLGVSGNANLSSAALAYSAIPEEGSAGNEAERSRVPRPVALAATALAAILVISVVALVISLAANVRPTVAQRPHSGGSAAAPTNQAPPPKAKAPAVQPAPSAPPPAAPAPPPSVGPAPPPETIPAPAPVAAPRPVAAPNPEPQAPIRQAPRRAPAYVPAPAPAPAAPPPAAQPAPAAQPPEPAPAAPPPEPAPAAPPPPAAPPAPA
ncbi:MAG: hypothetical protein JOZ23_01895, partial [Mycobacterium sp.]|nr:hypothetical protein [Mycobacterium sp.]